MLFYHVDRGLSLQNVKIIELQKVVDPEIFPDFKDGLSQQGVHYFAHNFKQSGQFDSYFWDLSLEYIRKIHFPHMPSRFQMLFAHDNLNDAVQWAKDYSNEHFAGIAKIESEQFLKFDSSWLMTENIRNLPPDIDVTSFAAFCQNCMRYWNQEFSESPTVEYLLPLPCQIQDYTLLYL